jgi:hypothetical protein
MKALEASAGIGLRGPDRANLPYGDRGSPEIPRKKGSVFAFSRVSSSGLRLSLNSLAWPLRKSHMAPGKFFVVVREVVTKGTWEGDE